MNKYYLTALLVVMPIDWFKYTGELLREAGAKPINLILFAFGIAYLLRVKNFRLKVSEFMRHSYALLFSITILGTLAFVLDILIDGYKINDRSQLQQFINQTLMMLMFVVNVFSATRIIIHVDAKKHIMFALRAAAIIHLSFLLIETSGILNGIFYVFRNENGLIDRASGLMSEPSYYGFFAACYALPLFIYAKKYYVFDRVLSVLLILSAFNVGAKTTVLIMGVSLIYSIVFFDLKPSYKKSVIILIVCLIAGSDLLLSAVDVEGNLSSIMRFGSSLLAVNLISSWHGIFGVGIGQFHFYYTENFAPDFLMVSAEAIDQMNGLTGIRASTYNLFIRFFSEAGILGGILYIYFNLRILIKGRDADEISAKVGVLFVVSSLTFLLTQDSYCFPGLVIGIALCCSCRSFSV